MVVTNVNHFYNGNHSVRECRLITDQQVVRLMIQETTDDRTILLLHPGLVVLAVSPGTGELDVSIRRSTG